MRSAALAFALLTAACSGIAAPDVAQLPANSTVTQGIDPGGKPYTLAAGDKLRVKVFNEPELTGEYEVGAAGFVSLPLAGQIKASGLTTSQFEQAIANKLKSGIMRQPRVNVEIATYRPFYIHGEVKKAGEYPYRAGMTVADAVAVAGGFTYRANEGRVFVRRAGATGEEAHRVDAAVPIYPGDNIRVPERYF